MISSGHAWTKVFDDLHTEIYKIVEPLTDVQINWTHPHLTNSAGNLLRHIAGSERYWIGEVIGGRLAHRVREQEFVHETLRKEPLVDALRVAQAAVRPVVDGLSAAALTDEVDLVRGDQRQRVSKAWVLTHSLTHTAYHVGQLQLFRKMALAGKGS